WAAVLLLVWPTGQGFSQSRLKSMPGYEHYQRMSRERTNAVKLGTLGITWQDGGKAFEYQKDGKTYRYEIARAKSEIVTNAPAKASDSDSRRNEGTNSRPRRPSAPSRGRQYT